MDGVGELVTCGTGCSLTLANLVYDEDQMATDFVSLPFPNAAR